MPYLLLVFLLSVSSCNFFKQKTSKKSINMAFPLEVATLDPAGAYDSQSLKAIGQTIETLYAYHYLRRPYKPEPLLAEGFPKIDKGGRRYTISIKKNVPYHDHPVFGDTKRYVKAQDFVNQIKRVAYAPIKSAGLWLFKGKVKGIDHFTKTVKDMDSFLKENIEGVYAKDDNTLVIELNQPENQMLHLLSMSFVSPIPIEFIKKYKNNLSKNIIGTGPFILSNWEKGKKITLKRFPSYRNSLYPNAGDRYAHSKGLLKRKKRIIPFVDEVNIFIEKDENELFKKFLRKEIDWIEAPKELVQKHLTSSGELSQEMKSKNVKLQIYPSFSLKWLGFNMNDPILGKNKNLRLAITHAINVDEFIDKFTQNTSLRANSILLPGIPGYSPSRNFPYKYDLKKAKAYLESAGYPEGKGLPVFTYTTRSKSQTQISQANWIREKIEKIGVKIKIEQVEFKDFLKRGRAGDLQFWMDGWIYDFPVAENIIQLLLSKNSPGVNKSAYSNPSVDKLYKKLAGATKGNERKRILDDIEKTVHMDNPWILIFYNRSYLLYHNHLKNFRYASFIYNDLKYWDLEF
ncbi:MAG: hypothetical protein HOE90_15055 [Bacteriovoracaceae bacterium]|jgi:oligopeptide transport system substrate-binding protein|nr:hypothetical protein [Bacteriovoracaceae bacterium]